MYLGRLFTSEQADSTVPAEKRQEQSPRFDYFEQEREPRSRNGTTEATSSEEATTRSTNKRKHREKLWTGERNFIKRLAESPRYGGV